MKHTKNMIIKQSAESRELAIFADNESTIYFSDIVPAVKNLIKKYNKGIFDSTKAIDAFYPAADHAARLYCKRFTDQQVNYVFDVTARYTAAYELLNKYMENIENNDI